MTDTDFEPDGFGIQESRDGNDIRLVFFKHDGSERAAAFPRSQLPQLLAELHKIESGKVVPMRPKNLQLGSDFQLHGWQVAPGNPTGIELTLFVNLPSEDRVVMLPITFPDQQIENLLQDIEARRVR